MALQTHSYAHSQQNRKQVFTWKWAFTEALCWAPFQALEVIVAHRIKCHWAMHVWWVLCIIHHHSIKDRNVTWHLLLAYCSADFPEITYLNLILDHFRKSFQFKILHNSCFATPEKVGKESQLWRFWHLLLEPRKLTACSPCFTPVPTAVPCSSIKWPRSFVANGLSASVC